MNDMNILLVHTGGTIGSVSADTARVQNAATVAAAKRDLMAAFEQSGSPYAASVHITDALFPAERTTLSESMTLAKLGEIACFVRDSLTAGCYDGVVVLHGTDTLAYTAALFSFLFADIAVPMVLVSGNRPPRDPLSNASANFTAAVEQIAAGLAPNVYVTYRNTDGVMRLYVANTLLQCENFSEDFRGAFPDRVFPLCDETQDDVHAVCRRLSAARVSHPRVHFSRFERFSERVLLIRPYTGLDYTVFEPVLASGKYDVVVHGTYHSGTVCYPKTESAVSQSIGALARMCETAAVPLYIAPSTLGSDQYETMNAVNDETDAVLLNMTTEAAYAKLTVALSFGLSGEQLTAYMQTNVNNEQ